MSTILNRKPSAHLTDEEFIDFVLEDLPEELEEQIDQHLEYCVACAQRLESFYTAQEAFPTERWAAEKEEFIATLRRAVLGPPPIWAREALRNFLRPLVYQNVALVPAFRTRPEPLSVVSEDREFAVDVYEEDNGDVIVRLSSFKTELEGVAVRLYAGDWERRVRLHKVTQDQVGVEVIIRREERAALPPDTVLRAEPVKE